MLDWLRTAIQTMFRFFPFPVETGLRVVGQPGPDAPVFVTCNFDLTVRRVLTALQGMDCYLLVAPSRGINVWCAAGGGILTAHSVASVVKTSRIAEKVNHRLLILPQLSAPGIDTFRVQQDTGWRCKFGPVYARDIAAYVTANYAKTDEMRRAKFPLGDRLEMAVMWAVPMSILGAVVVAIVNWRSLPAMLALVWTFSLFTFALYDPIMRLVPGGVGLIKTLVLGVVGTCAVWAYGWLVADWEAGVLVGWSLGILTVAAVLGFDLDGSSPINAGATVAYWGRKWPATLDLWAKIGYELEEWFTLQVDVDRCKGCKTCVQVCPKGVFDLCRVDGSQKSRVARMSDCEQCTACVKQCPEGAILADPPIRGFS